MTLDSLTNCLAPTDFKDDIFGRKDKNKTALQVLKDPGIAIRKLYALGIPFNITIATSGRTPAGIAFVSVNVALNIGSQTYTMPGSSEGETPNHGIAGVQLQAINNALLRNFRMAEFQYGEIEETTPTVKAPVLVARKELIPTTVQEDFDNLDSDDAMPEYTAPVAVAPKPAFKKNNFKGNKTGGYNGPKKDFGPWDGSLKFKTGKHAGKSYNEVPLDYLQFLATMEKPLEVAVMELNRRLAVQGLPNLDVNEGDVY